MVKPIRVLFFVSEYDRFYGGQHSLLQLVRNLPAAGVEAVVAFPDEGRCTAAYQAAGVPVEIIPGPKEFSLFGQHLLEMPAWQKTSLLVNCVLPYSFKLVQVMKRLKIDVLHCNTTRSLLLGGIAPYLYRYPIIWHVRGQLHSFSRTTRLICQVLASRIILVASALRTEIDPRFWPKCQAIYNGIDEEAIPDETDTPAGLPFGCDNGRPIILTVAAVTPFKGYHHLLEAARLINQHFADPSTLDEVSRSSTKRPAFLAIGDMHHQPYGDYLKGLISQYDLDNFYFLGWQQNPFPYYQLADVVVLPTVEREQLNIGNIVIDISSGEGLPRTVLEAMYLGKPSVATKVAGTAEQILDGETGLLVPPAAPEALASAILDLLQKPAALRQEMGQKAAIRARELFSTERMVHQTVSLYQELTGYVS